MNRRITILMVVLVISLALTGCGGGDKKTADTGGSAPVNDKAAQGKVDPGNSGGIKIGTVKSGKSMELPAEFPADILPILDDAQIDNIIKNDANKAININFNTGKSLKEAAAFYQEVMKDGRVTNEINSEDSYIIVGVKGNYVVSITIVAPQGATIVNIDTRPEDK